jgi:hypothetical protein
MKRYRSNDFYGHLAQHFSEVLIHIRTHSLFASECFFAWALQELLDSDEGHRRKMIKASGKNRCIEYERKEDHSTWPLRCFLRKLKVLEIFSEICGPKSVYPTLLTFRQ